MTEPTAVSIGNFDGVHLGHCRLVAAARAAVGPEGRVVVMSFDPHPISVLRPSHSPPRLTLFDQRKAWLTAAGADEVSRLKPTRDLLGMKARDFIASVVECYHPAAILEGPDFRFGRGRAGDVRMLRQMAEEFGFLAIVIDPVEAIMVDQSLTAVSSSMIRWLLARGRVVDAERLLGRPYELRGRVVRGEQRGRAIGFPTANLDCGDLLLPADGVYAGIGTDPDGTEHPAAISVGTKPTYGNHPRLCEAHLLGYDGPLDRYDWSMTLRFVRWLRDQLAYADADMLIEQLHRDIEQCDRLPLGLNRTPVARDEDSRRRLTVDR